MSYVFRIVPASAKAFWVLGAIALLLIGLLVLFGYIAYSSRRTRFEISPTGFSIAGGLYGRTIPAESLLVDQAMCIDLAESTAYRPKVRTNGAALPGYWAGWFRLENGDKALLFVTDRTRVVRVPTTEGYSVLVSVAEPKAFLQALVDVASGG